MIDGERKGGTMTNDVSTAVRDLVVANRILGHEGILDAFGHVSVRHPERKDRFFLSRARAPELVEADDVLEFSLDGSPTSVPGAPIYIERFIHGAVYERRPDVMAVCHNHTLSLLPFSISKSVRLRPVIHSAAFLGGEVPIWDIADEFGTETRMLVESIEEGRSLSRSLGAGSVVLMRGHGSVVVGGSLSEVVSRCISLDRNARTQLAAASLGGEMMPLHPGECASRSVAANDDRAWELWSRRVGF
ncbi:MAG TPA: class II aldolase/adducin family protein [Candidatus Dormibacteraeota bacterium]|nr:class II aldolase/adducin family protein [Candidatus Dormibacteraeota bacterium]